MIEFEWKRLLVKGNAATRFDTLKAELVALDGAVFSVAAGSYTCTMASLTGTSSGGEAAAFDDWCRAARRALLSASARYLILPAGATDLTGATLQGANWSGLTEGQPYHVFALADPVRIVPGQSVAAPTNTTAPAITGTATVGETLTAVG